MMKRLTAMVLALCVFAGVFFHVPAARADGYTVYVISNTMPVYSSASATSRKLGTMGYGISLTCTAVSGAWAQVRNSSGTTGYCAVNALSTSNPNTLNIATTINAANTPIYRLPSTGTAVWQRLEKDSTFTAVAMTRDNTWVRLKNGKAYAYVQAKYLSITGDSSAPDATTAPSEALSATVYATATAVPAYKSASTSSKITGYLYYGQSVTCVAVTGGWAQVRISSGATAYCQTSGLSGTDPNTLNRTVYINTDGAPIYKAPTASASVWMKLKKDMSFTAVAVTPDKQWTRLKNGSNYAYIPSKYISTAAPGAEQAVYAIDTGVTVYKSASTSSQSLGHIYLGQSVTLIGASDGWAKVRNAAGTLGYCLTAGLSNKDPNTLNKSFYAKAASVKLYKAPSATATVVATVAQNASLLAVCVSEDGQWARIALSNGSFAYALASDLSATKSDDSSLVSDIAPVTAYAVPTSLTIYASPSASSRSLGTLYFGQSITCTGAGGNWARVRNSAGTVGYCDADSLTTTNPNKYATPVYAQTDGAKVYKKPVTSSKVLATFSLNGQLTGVAYNSERTWYRVKSGNTYGYVQVGHFATTKVSEQVSSAAAKVVSFAKQYLGVPYVYGGQSPSGFDCSGFNYYVFKNAAGITLKRTAYSQGYDGTYPKIANKADLKVGDLLFFDTVPTDDDLCDHTGIFLGSNQFIHASSGGGKVMTSSLGSSSSDYYYRTYSWARRALK